MKNYPRSWDRQEDETVKAYNGFRIFLDLGVERTYAKTAEALGVGIDHISAWGRKYNWQSRAHQYDVWKQASIDDAEIDALKLFQMKVITEEVQDYQKLRAVWTKYLDGLVDKADEIAPDEFLNRLKKLTQTRTMIDNMARKSASLPNTYKPLDGSNLPTRDDDEPIMLSMTGPKQLAEGDDFGGEEDEGHY